MAHYQESIFIETYLNYCFILFAGSTHLFVATSAISILLIQELKSIFKHLMEDSYDRNLAIAK